MTEIVWDKVGERRFEAGISRGVLYPPGASGVAWNGLLGVDENAISATAHVYLYGMKIMDRPIFTDFSAKLSAFTYPAELDELVGISTYGGGLQVHGQAGKRFGISYRTDLGNDVSGLDLGYKIHLIYNAVASPSPLKVSTIAGNVSAESFEWDIQTKPVRLVGFRPTAHFVIDTTKAESDAVDFLEDTLYGRGSNDPTLPDPIDLVGIFANGPAPSSVVDEQGGWSISGEPQFFELSEDDTAFSVRNVKTTHSDENEYTMETD